MTDTDRIVLYTWFRIDPVTGLEEAFSAENHNVWPESTSFSGDSLDCPYDGCAFSVSVDELTIFERHIMWDHHGFQVKCQTCGNLSENLSEFDHHYLDVHEQANDNSMSLLFPGETPRPSGLASLERLRMSLLFLGETRRPSGLASLEQLCLSLLSWGKPPDPRARFARTPSYEPSFPGGDTQTPRVASVECLRMPHILFV
jgi:hypothetical protein